MKITTKEWTSAYFKVNDIGASEPIETELDYEESYSALVTHLILEMGFEKAQKLVKVAEKNYKKFINID